MYSDDHNVIQKQDPLAADIYLDRVYYYLTWNEIAEYRKISVSQCKLLFSRAKYILRNPNEYWMLGLSRRARLALQRNGYRNLEQLKKDLDNDVDLESKDGIGHMIDYEVRRWVKSR